MTIAFIRTYNNKQNSEVQEAVIREFAESQKIEIGKWAKEVGNSPRANRRLESIVKSLSPGDEILVSDISRVSRKMIEIIHIILLCIERKVTLRSVSDGYVFEDNIDSKTYFLISGGFLMGKFPVMRIKVGQDVLPLDAESMQAIADAPCWHYAKSSLRFFVFRSF